MACSCKTKTDSPQPPPPLTLPEEPCIFCAEKHFSTAMALFCELGYRSVNRQRIIGELVLSCWHLYQLHPRLAADIRVLRHEIEQREDELAASEWTKLASQFETIVTEETKKEKQ